VPICHECNQSKGSIEAATPHNQLIHPYFEQLPDIQFIRAAISLIGGALTVEYDVDPSAHLTDLTKIRLAFQLRRLKLNERYQREIKPYLTSYTVALRMCFESGGGEGVKAFLRLQAQAERTRFHRNHWRPVLLQSLSDHDAFCDGEFQTFSRLTYDLSADLGAPHTAGRARISSATLRFCHCRRSARR